MWVLEVLEPTKKSSFVAVLAEEKQKAKTKVKQDGVSMCCCVAKGASTHTGH